MSKLWQCLWETAGFAQTLLRLLCRTSPHGPLIILFYFSTKLKELLPLAESMVDRGLTAMSRWVAFQKKTPRYTPWLVLWWSCSIVSFSDSVWRIVELSSAGPSVWPAGAAAALPGERGGISAAWLPFQALPAARLLSCARARTLLAAQINFVEIHSPEISYNYKAQGAECFYNTAVLM